MNPTAQAVIDLLQERGWCQGQGLGPEGQLCLVAAISMATGIEGRRPFMEKVRTQADTACVSIWNDRPWRKPEHVFALLRAIP